MAAIDPAHYLHSSVRENMLEHMFLAELARAAWRQGRFDLEVLRPEVDHAGYDLVLESGGIFRHVQLKSMHREGRRRKVGIATQLATKPAGCVIWLLFDSETLALGPFLWLGGGPREPLPPLGDKLVRHTKGDRLGHKSERGAQREVPGSRFTKLVTIDEVIGALFGTGATSGPPCPVEA